MSGEEKWRDVGGKTDDGEEDVGGVGGRPGRAGPLRPFCQQRLGLFFVTAEDRCGKPGVHQMAGHAGSHHAGANPSNPRFTWRNSGKRHAYSTRSGGIERQAIRNSFVSQVYSSPIGKSSVASAS